MIKIRSHIRDYSVHFVDIEDCLSEIGERYPHSCFIVDAGVWKVYKSGLLAQLKNEETFILAVDENNKRLSSVAKIWDFFLKRSAKRNLTVISIGGGITQDITGFAASTIYRGINWIFVPTTLLAQADSCIGSKTSLNYKGFKNLIGTFYPPSEILMDTRFLLTQKDPDFYSGLGEIVKLHIMGGNDSVKRIISLLPKIISKDKEALLAGIRDSLLIKQGYLEEDEFDLGRRNLLNYGHCFGHALESVSDFAVPHGQAVVIGMVLANLLARRRGILSEDSDLFIRKKLLLPSLVIKLKKCFFISKSTIAAMKKDKKRINENLTVIMLADDYHFVKATDVTVTEVKDALDALQEILFSNQKKPR